MHVAKNVSCLGKNNSRENDKLLKTFWIHPRLEIEQNQRRKKNDVGSF